VVFGELVHGDLQDIEDLNWREKLTFLPLMVTALWIGIYPTYFTAATDASVQNLVTQIRTKIAANAAATPADAPEAGKTH